MSDRSHHYAPYSDREIDAAEDFARIVEWVHVGRLIATIRDREAEIRHLRYPAAGAAQKREPTPAERLRAADDREHQARRDEAAEELDEAELARTIGDATDVRDEDSAERHRRPGSERGDRPD